MNLRAKLEAIRAGDAASLDVQDDSRDAQGKAARRRSTGHYFELESLVDSPWIAGSRSAVSNFIGAYSYVNSGGYLRENVLIGRYVSIGRRVTIAAGGHNMRALSTSPSIRGTPAGPFTADQDKHVRPARVSTPFTEIESDVWIGDGAVIRPGVKLAIGSVIGANAVVVRDTNPYEIVGGVAAKSLGFRFDAEVRDALLSTEWWEYDREAINRYPCANVFEFLEAFNRNPPHRIEFDTYRS